MNLVPPPPTNALWVDIDESTGKLTSVKEFVSGKWENSLIAPPVGAVTGKIKTVRFELGDSEENPEQIGLLSEKPLLAKPLEEQDDIENNQTEKYIDVPVFEFDENWFPANDDTNDDLPVVKPELKVKAPIPSLLDDPLIISDALRDMSIITPINWFIDVLKRITETILVDNGLRMEFEGMLEYLYKRSEKNLECVYISSDQHGFNAVSVNYKNYYQQHANLYVVGLQNCPGRDIITNLFNETILFADIETKHCFLVFNDILKLEAEKKYGNIDNGYAE